MPHVKILLCRKAAYVSFLCCLEYACVYAVIAIKKCVLCCFLQLAEYGLVE